MMQFKTGNLLDSSSQALVNTVNCEGYMGKGIAYQFKLKFPNMFQDYQRVCKRNELSVGKIHTYLEKDKTIINFPTKKYWREKSKIQYIELGLDALSDYIIQNNINSIAIPPLGSGNGGLNWSEVRDLICTKLSDISKNVEIEIYEPSINYIAKPTNEPQLSMSALVLMKMKQLLNENIFGNIGLQKTAYFVNIFYHKEYFHFAKDKYGPYDHSISIISNSIKLFQQYHNVDTDKAYEILYNKLVSKNIEEKINDIEPAIIKATTFSNSLSSIHDLEGVATVLYLIIVANCQNDENILMSFKNWSEDKAIRFSENDIYKYINHLLNKGIIQNGLFGYTLCDDV